MFQLKNKLLNIQKHFYNNLIFFKNLKSCFTTCLLFLTKHKKKDLKTKYLLSKSATQVCCLPALLLSKQNKFYRLQACKYFDN